MIDWLTGAFLFSLLILSVAYLFFATVRGWWRACRGPFLDEVLDLCRGWKVNVPWWKVPGYFLVFVIGAALSTYLGDLLIRWAVLRSLGYPPH